MESVLFSPRSMQALRGRWAQETVEPRSNDTQGLTVNRGCCSRLLLRCGIWDVGRPADETKPVPVESCSCPING